MMPCQFELCAMNVRILSYVQFLLLLLFRDYIETHSIIAKVTVTL